MKKTAENMFDLAACAAIAYFAWGYIPAKPAAPFIPQGKVIASSAGAPVTMPVNICHVCGNRYANPQVVEAEIAAKRHTPVTPMPLKPAP